ncbi:MAG TPA: hypothetical protein VFW66_08205 [Gemmatimonadales bacterium]|nr:hypothetical protein [Gemmatimonadales bacterium]
MSRSRRPANTVRLNESQRRHLAVFLEQLEEALGEIERLADLPARPARLLEDVRDLNPQFGTAVRDRVLDLRERIGELADRLGLEPRVQSRQRRVAALVSRAIVDLEDAGSRGLAGYGEVDPGVAREIDPALAEMVSRLEAIAARLRSPE